MTVFDRVKLLANKQGISIVELEEKLGFGRNSLYSWKTKTPNGDRLTKVADYFGVTIDYLLGRPDRKETNVELSDDDVIMTWRGKPLSDEDRELIRRIMNGK